VIIGLSLVGIVSGAYTDYEKTDYLGPDALPTVNDALDLNTAFTSLTNDVTDFGPSSIFKSGDDWVEEVDALEKRNTLLFKDRELYKTTQYPSNVEAVNEGIVKNYRLIIKANKLAITKYSEDNAQGKNDKKNSQRHFDISQNLDFWDRDENDKTSEASLAALKAATEADITNVKAWDAGIQNLKDMGRYAEADQVRDEMNQRVGSTALGMLLPLSPFTALSSIVLAGMSFVLFSRRMRANLVN